MFSMCLCVICLMQWVPYMPSLLINLQAFTIIWTLFSISRDTRIGYNSLGAFASVNHLHFHVYQLPHKLYIETAVSVLLYQVFCSS